MHRHNSNFYRFGPAKPHCGMLILTAREILYTGPLNVPGSAVVARTVQEFFFFLLNFSLRRRLIRVMLTDYCIGQLGILARDSVN